MGTGKVYSILTGRPLNQQDYKKNDKLAAGGLCLGCLPGNMAASIRNFQEKLNCEINQSNIIQQGLHNSLNNYVLDVNGILKFFKVKMDRFDFDVDIDKLMVGEDGHTWLVLGERSCENE